MNSLDSSAPGKLILSGEYTVLCGAPAISIALDRRAEVKIIEQNDSAHMVSTSGYYHGNWRYYCDENGIELLWGVGGGKIQSSSDLIRNSKK